MATLEQKRQKRQFGFSTVAVGTTAAGYKVTVGFKNKMAMKNFVEDLRMSKDESIKIQAKTSLNDVKNGATKPLSDFLKKHGA